MSNDQPGPTVYGYSYAPAASTGTGLGTASLIIGLVSLLAGWTFVAPIIGIMLGVRSRRQEPYARTVAAWGIGLNVFCMLGWLVVGVLLFVFGGALGLALL